MSDASDTATFVAPAAADDTMRTVLDWLESEFPGWSFHVDRTATWGHHRTIWIARRDGHHPQSELSPAKLHTRLTDYLHRETRRRAMMN